MKRTQAVALSGDTCFHGRKALPLLISLLAPALAACSSASVDTASTAAWSAKTPQETGKRAIALAKSNPRERDCLVRAMYFESNRTSTSGLLSVGTVVMNRVKSPRYPDTICGVVGAPRQFAAGVLTRPMSPRDLPKVEAVAEEILNGRRSDAVGNAKHFHMAGMRFSYPNMHYMTVAGGNAFYVKGERPERGTAQPSYQLAAVSSPAPIMASTPAAPAAQSFAVALGFAAQEPANELATETAAETAAPEVETTAAPQRLALAVLPPSRPIDLGLPRKSIRAFVPPPKSGTRLAALMPGMRGSNP